MSLRDLLVKLDDRQVNKAYVNYKDENGNMENVCYQDKIFFRVIDTEKVQFLNPLRVAETLQKIESKELKLMGSGTYLQPVDFKNHYKNNNKKGYQPWKLF